MGSVCGTLQHWTSSQNRDPMRCILITPKLLGVSEILQIYGEFREEFTSYFISGVWLSDFAEEKGRIVWTSVSSNKIFLDLLASRVACTERESFDKANEDKKVSSSSRKTLVMSSIAQRNDSFICLLIACAFPQFLVSKQYSSFVKNCDIEHQKVLKQFRENVGLFKNRRISKDSDSSTERISSIQISGRSFSTVDLSTVTAQPNDHSINSNALIALVTDRVTSCRLQDISSLLANNSNAWLSNILKFILDLPYAISVAKISESYYSREASRKAIGSHMPIAYVNHAYEQLMQFPSYDLEGFPINCLFDASVAGESVVDAVEKSLEEMKPLQTLMKMERRSGEIVDTWLATCPVFNNMEHAYTHVIVMQHKIPPSTNEDGGIDAAVLSETIEDMEQLLCLLSKILY